MACESQWVTFKVGEETFGFEIQYVRELLVMPEVHAVPCASSDNLGVILLRSEVIPVFDLRRKFGLDSRSAQADSFVEIFKARQKDHENWLTELEASIVEEREFALTTDPHQCKFGKWYDSYVTDDSSLVRVMKRFDEPHRQIHSIALSARDYVSAGHREKALDLVKACRDTALQQMIQLFAEAVTQVQDSARQNLIVVGSESSTLGIAVDEIRAVVRCRDDEIQAPDSIPGSVEFGGLIGLLPQKGHDRFIMLLDPAQIYPQLVAAM